MLRAATLASIALLGAAMATPAQAALIYFQSSLSPGNETPPVLGSAGTGTVWIDYDNTAHTLQIRTVWSGLTAGTTASHIHCCSAPITTAGVAVTPVTLPGFPNGLTSGSYVSPLLDLTAASTYTAGFVTNFAGGVLANAESALINGFLNGQAYFNIHTTFAPGVEIRGTIAVPEPGTLSMVAMGLLGLLGMRRRIRG